MTSLLSRKEIAVLPRRGFGRKLGNVRTFSSKINLEILKALREHQIDIPYPQRVVYKAGFFHRFAP